MSTVFHAPVGTCLFLHIPRTGGTFIESVLGQLNVRSEAVWVDGVSRHGLLWHYAVLQKLDFVFAFVRHPVSWYESWYRFQCGKWKSYEPERWHPQRCLERCGHDDFGEFVFRCLTYQPGYVTRMYEWFLGPPGDDMVHFVGRQENLGADFSKALELCGLEVSRHFIDLLPRRNISKPAEIVWPEGLQSDLVAVEQPAIERFYREGLQL